MGVLLSDIGYTPCCDACGIHMCWDISDEEYFKAKEFWDKWSCRECNPDYKGALKRWHEARTQS